MGAAAFHDRAISRSGLLRDVHSIRKTRLGALIGLPLVVVQLQQTREMMRAQMRHDLAMGIVELLNSAAANNQFASVLRRGGAGEELDADERYQFRARTNALFRYWEDVHYQYRQGLHDEEEFSKHKEEWRAYLAASKGAVSYWCEVRQLYSPKFAAQMDALLPAPGCWFPGNGAAPYLFGGMGHAPFSTDGAVFDDSCVPWLDHAKADVKAQG